MRWFIAISFLLHLLFFYFYGVSTNFNWVKLSSEPKEEKQIVFEFEQKPKEVIETPDIPANEAPENADLFSDKNMTAKNPDKTDQVSDTPLSRGQE